MKHGLKELQPSKGHCGMANPSRVSTNAAAEGDASGSTASTGDVLGRALALIEDGEGPVAAMIRETREEAGLVVVPESIRPYGYVHRAQRSDRDPQEIFIQDNYYYLCEAEATAVAQKLDGYEAKERYTLEWVDPQTAIDKNRSVRDCPYNRMMFEREARVLELLIKEGYCK